MKTEKIYIISNGGQAPYGINETIDIIPARHIRKIHQAVSRCYNQPVMRLGGKDGERMQFVFNGNSGKLIGLEKWGI